MHLISWTLQSGSEQLSLGVVWPDDNTNVIKTYGWMITVMLTVSAFLLVG